MSDEEDYSSADDEDYVPSDKEGLSEEDESGEEEDLAVLNEGGNSENRIAGKRKRKKAKNDFVSRKRKGGIKLDGEECGDGTDDIANKQLKEEIAKEEEAAKEEKEKKKADDLWSSFMSDVGRKPKPAAKPAPSSGGLGSLTTVQPKKPQATPNGSSMSVKPEGASSSATTQKITVTKVFDFAGEEVKIKEEVDVQSKEGQKELKRLEEENGSGDNKDSCDSDSKPITAQILGQGLPLAGKSSPRPAGGLGSVLGKIGKKNKLSALTKSKLDWDSYKKEEGIEEDLKIHNRGKDGYIERMQFLQRADVRQFEIEKSLRQTSSKR